MDTENTSLQIKASPSPRTCLSYVLLLIQWMFAECPKEIFIPCFCCVWCVYDSCIFYCLRPIETEKTHFHKDLSQKVSFALF